MRRNRGNWISEDSVETGVKLVFWIIVLVCWCINTIQLFTHDFKEPFKVEVIKIVGAVIPPLSTITCFVNENKEQ